MQYKNLELISQELTCHRRENDLPFGSENNLIFTPLAHRQMQTSSLTKQLGQPNVTDEK